MSDPHGPASAKGTFRSLDYFNYRLWAMGAIVSNIGTWMQFTAQDWLVLTVLTHNNGTSLGIVMALQYGPQLLLLPVTGLVVDRVDKRRLLMITQGLMGILALGLGVLTLSGLVQLWHVYVFAFSLGCVAAFDSPARQTFVSALVPKDTLSNAVALNSTSFNLARMIGPAVAGVLISIMGTGPVFLINGLSFGAVLISLTQLRRSELLADGSSKSAKGGLISGFVYVLQRPDLMVILMMIFLIGTFGLNFQIFISTMSVKVFHKGAGQYGLLSSIMAMGSISGTLLSARREKPNFSVLLFGTAIFGFGFIIASLMPNYWLFGLSLIIIGMAAQTITTTANGTLQMNTEPTMRGRVMAIFMAIALGGTPLGAPFVGFVADRFGPRAALYIGAFAGLSAALIGLLYLIRFKRLRLVKDEGHYKFLMD